MPRPRSSAVELARLLGAAGQAVFVLDDAWHVAFCNRACLDWLAVDEDQLLGRRVAYHSQPGADPADALANLLAPPPEVYSGQERTVTVSIAGQTRRVRFIPLPGEGGPIAVLGLVDPRALGDAPQHPAEPAADELHDALRRWRRRWAAWHQPDRLLGDSPAIQRVRAQVEMAARCQAAALIVGPHGAGRQRVATTIHYAARGEAAGPLIPLACPVLSAELLASTVRAMGMPHADSAPQPQGTLLLGDVDQIAAEAQAELVALLVGRDFPLRLIATSRSDLSEMARCGRYRADLAETLSTIVIRLSPLAERRDDLPLLAQAMLEDVNAKGARQVSGFTSDALDLMALYSWPGNLDELAMVVAEAHTHCEGTMIESSDLPQRLHLAAHGLAHPRRQVHTIVLDEFLGQVERELIRRALRQSKGNKAKAARLLGMTRPRLYRKMEHLGMIERGEEEPRVREKEEESDEPEAESGE